MSQVGMSDADEQMFVPGANRLGLECYECTMQLVYGSPRRRTYLNGLLDGLESKARADHWKRCPIGAESWWLCPDCQMHIHEAVNS